MSVFDVSLVAWRRSLCPWPASRPGLAHLSPVSWHLPQAGPAYGRRCKVDNAALKRLPEGQRGPSTQLSGEISTGSDTEMCSGNSYNHTCFLPVSNPRAANLPLKLAKYF